MPASFVIGREQELGAIETFLAEGEQGPRALVLSGEAGIGKTILWETGVESASQTFGRVLTCRGVEAEASLSFAGLSELLAPVFDEVATSLLSPRRRALEIALLRVEPSDQPPDAHAIGLAVLDLLCALAERGPVLVALDDLQWLDPASAGGDPDRGAAPARGTGRAPGDRPDGAEDRNPFRARALLSGGAARRADARPAQPGRRPQSARGATRARADPARARPRAGGDCGQPLFRSRARPRTRPHGHTAGAGTGIAGAREPARPARRPPRPAARGDRRRPASGRGVGATDRRVGRGGARGPGARPRSARDGRPRRRRRAQRVAPALLAPVARLDLLRAGSDLEAPRGAPRARGGRHGRRGAGLSPRLGRRGAGYRGAGFARGPGYWPPVVERRKSIYQAMREWSAPPALGRVPDDITEPMTVMLWRVTSKRIEEWLSDSTGPDERRLTGFAGSPGTAEGRARVILHADQLGEIQDGEILVAPSTSTSWTPVFGTIAAAVLDVGGMMCHAAIVAREYGLPAVIGTGSATKRIKTGDRVRVDAHAGVVTILDRA